MMAQLAPWLVLASGLAHAIVNAILKSGKDKLAGRALIDGFSALIVAPAAFFVPLPDGAWHWLLLSWVIHLFYLVSLVKAFERADMTVAYPIARGLAPMLAAGAAVLLFHEPITAAVAVGIVLVCGGVLTIAVGRRVDRVGLSWSLATGVSIAAYTVVDAQGVRAAPTAASYIVWTFIMLGGGIATVFAWWGRRDFGAALRGQWKPGLAAGALSIVTYGLALLAFRYGATPGLAALREVSILFGTAIAVFFLGEKLSRTRLIGVCTIAIGAMVLIAFPR